MSANQWKSMKSFVARCWSLVACCWSSGRAVQAACRRQWAETESELTSAIWAQGLVLYFSTATLYSKMSDGQSDVSSAGLDGLGSLASCPAHSAGLGSLAASDDDSAACHEDGPVPLAAGNPLPPTSVFRIIYICISCECLFSCCARLRLTKHKTMFACCIRSVYVRNV